ncbi:MAG: hypothetical protein FJ145_00675 [Deltaproteobacteria bacterium]|nr:hypothetical protein [Deltaproteobacteria bacterium]
MRHLSSLYFGAMVWIVILAPAYSQLPTKPPEFQPVQPIQPPKLPPNAVPQIPVRLGADLVVETIEILVSNPGDNPAFATGRPIYTHSSVNIRPIFKNIGTTTANIEDVSWALTGGPTIPQGTLYGRTFGGRLRGALAPNATTTGSLGYFGPGQVAAGTYTINVTVDSANRVVELSEINNVTSVSLTVLPSNLYTGQADLRFGTVSVTEDTSNPYSLKRNYVVDATVINAGTFPAYLHGNGVIRAEKNLTTSHSEGYFVSLFPNQTKTIRFSASVDYGATLTETLTTDSMQLVAESDETNNSYTLTIAAPPRPISAIGDLVITDAYFEYFPNPNRFYFLKVTLRNHGPGTVTICDHYSWVTKNAPEGLGWVANAPQHPVQLGPGQSYTPSTSARQSLSQGAFSLTLEANPNRTIPERHYTNNSYTFTVRIPEDVRTSP